MTQTPPSTEQINEVARKVYIALFGSNVASGYQFDKSRLLWDVRSFDIAAKICLRAEHKVAVEALPEDIIKKLDKLARKFYAVWNSGLEPPPTGIYKSTYKLDKDAWYMACLAFEASTDVLNINDMSIKEVLRTCEPSEPSEPAKRVQAINSYSLSSIVATPVEVELASALERVRVLELREADYRRALHKAQEAFLTLERNSGYRSVDASGEPSTLPPNCVLRAVIAVATALQKTPDSEVVESAMLNKAKQEALVWLERQRNTVEINWNGHESEWSISYAGRVWPCERARGGIAGAALRIMSFTNQNSDLAAMESTSRSQ